MTQQYDASFSEQEEQDYDIEANFPGNTNHHWVLTRAGLSGLINEDRAMGEILYYPNVVLRRNDDRGNLENWKALSLIQCQIPHLICPQDTDMSRSSFNYAEIPEARMRGVNLTESNWDHAKADHLVASGANFMKSRMPCAQLMYADLSNALMSGTILTSAWLSHAQLENTILHGANLTHAHLLHASCIGTDFTNATMDSVNASFAHFSKTEFKNVNTRNMNLSGALLHNCNMTGMSLLYVDMTGVRFGGSVAQALDMLNRADLTELYYQFYKSAYLIGRNNIKQLRGKLAEGVPLEKGLRGELGLGAPLTPEKIEDALSNNDPFLAVERFANGLSPAIIDEKQSDPSHSGEVIARIMLSWIDRFFGEQPKEGSAVAV